MASLSIPINDKLSSSLRISSTNPAVQKILHRLSRESLISLALDWLDEASLPDSAPYLALEDDEEDEDDAVYPPSESVAELQQLYVDMQQQKGSRRDLASRILEGDWRHGLTLYQLAMADLAYYDQNPNSQKWLAYSILPLLPPSKDASDEVLRVDQKTLHIPNFHPSTFLQNLQKEALPDIKAHYHFHRPKDLPVLLLRIFVVDSPYNTSLALSSRVASGAPTSFDSARTVLIAFPDGSPFIYLSKTQSTGPVATGEAKSLHSLIVDGIPKALSSPRKRYTLKPSRLSSKNLAAILENKGSGRTNAAGGGWSIYTDEAKTLSPLDTVLPTPPLSREASDVETSRKRGISSSSRVESAAKRARLIAKARFGNSAMVTDRKGLERVDIVLQDPFPEAITPTEDPGGGESGDDAEQSRKKRRRRSKIDTTIQEARESNDEGNDDSDIDMSANSSRWAPTIKISFQGPHVWAGVRQLVEAGVVDGERMPGWMTGEEGVTTGIVRHGRIRGHKGSGI